jgi:hypothetical protein
VLSRYTEGDDVSSTLELDLSPYLDNDSEDTLPVPLTKEDAIDEAHARLRMGSIEAAGVWFLVAGELA